MRLLLMLLALLAGVAPAEAENLRLVRLDSPAARSFVMLYNAIDIRFSAAFSHQHLIGRDFDGVEVMGIARGRICLAGSAKGFRDGNPTSDAEYKYNGSDVCSPLGEVSARVATPSAAGAPAAPLFHNGAAKTCAWRWTTGGHAGLWGEVCTGPGGRSDIVYDRTSQSFVLRSNGRARDVAMREFPMDPRKGPDGLLKSLRAQGLVPGDPDCKILRYQADLTPPGWSAWTVKLTGERGQREYSAAYHSDTYRGPSCGVFSHDGRHTRLRYFVVNDAHKDRAYFIRADLGEAMIDPFSITMK